MPPDPFPPPPLVASDEKGVRVRVVGQKIVKLVDYFATSTALCIVQDYCNARDLAHEVKSMQKTKNLFKEDVIWNWFLQLSCAVKHIHDRKILHRDIKTANIFLHQPDPSSWPVVKLGDFGISKALDQTAALAKSTVGNVHARVPRSGAPCYRPSAS